MKISSKFEAPFRVVKSIKCYSNGCLKTLACHGKHFGDEKRQKLSLPPNSAFLIILNCAPIFYIGLKNVVKLHTTDEIISHLNFDAQEASTKEFLIRFCK